MSAKGMTVKVLIIDDEAPARKKLELFVADDTRFSVVGEAKNGPDALEKIAELKPDLLLLDIQMPGMTGFDVLRLMETGSPAIIFTTAYDEYAVQAFEVSAIDYLLKPISQQRLSQALDKVINQTQSNWDEKIDNVLDTLEHKTYASRLAVRHLKRIHLLNVEDISHIASEHRLITVYDHEGERFWTNENLSQLEPRLDSELFMRVHRGAIINLSAKFTIEPCGSGRLKLNFNNGQELFVSRDYAVGLKERLGV